MPKTTQFFVKMESGFDRWEETWSNQGRNLKKKKKNSQKGVETGTRKLREAIVIFPIVLNFDS